MAGYPPNGNQPPQQPGAYPPQQPPPGAPAPYGHGGMQGGGHLKPHRGTMILVFGILGFLFCPIFAILAMVMGGGDLKAMKAGTMDRSGESVTNAGKIIGLISLILWALGIALYIAAIAFVISTMPEAATTTPPPMP